LVTAAYVSILDVITTTSKSMPSNVQSYVSLGLVVFAPLWLFLRYPYTLLVRNVVFDVQACIFHVTYLLCQILTLVGLYTSKPLLICFAPVAMDIVGWALFLSGKRSPSNARLSLSDTCNEQVAPVSKAEERVDSSLQLTEPSDELQLSVRKSIERFRIMDEAVSTN
jgi:hypothetical protein